MNIKFFTKIQCTDIPPTPTQKEVILIIIMTKFSKRDIFPQIIHHQSFTIPPFIKGNVNVKLAFNKIGYP